MPIISCFPTKVENDDRYLRLIGGQMQGNLDMDSHAIRNVADPVNDRDAANKEYVDNEITIALVGNYVPMSAKGEASGVAELDETGKVPSTQLPAMDYVPNSSVGAAGGVAELDSSGRVPQAQLPSYVDDVVEYASQSAFPETGEAGKIYVALDTNLTYRWGGSEYVEISPSLALGETESTAYRGDRGKAAYDHSQVTSGNPHGTTAADVGALTQTQADGRYIVLGGGGTAQMDSGLGTGPFTIEFTEEEDPSDTFLTADQAGVAGGIATLGDDGKLTSSQLPDLSGKADATALNSHTGNTSNPHSVTAAQVGAVPTTEKGAANGVATLGSDGAIPSEQISASDVLKFGSDGTNGQWDRQSAAPTGTQAIRYNGYLRATRVYGMYFSDDADYAEAYQIEDSIEPGELVMICPDGTLKRNNIQGNPRVLGIVSTAPASVIGGEGAPIALAGRAPVKAVGKVAPGDFLIGSAIPGAVEAAEDAPRGAVVAQALEGCDNGGVILARVLRL